ncbi:MAG: hypothetical protein COA38_10125 [Fluviicola sp.]|nr:MAG: hypothetical protein COA38_10125 [Fluviicola sp.]
MAEKNETTLLDNKILTSKLKWSKAENEQWNVVFEINPKTGDVEKEEYSLTFDDWLNRVNTNGTVRVCGKGFPHDIFNTEKEKSWFTASDVKNGKVLWLDSPNGRQRIPVLRNPGVGENANEIYSRLIVDNTHKIGSIVLQDALDGLQNIDIVDLESISTKLNTLNDDLEKSKPDLRNAAVWEDQIEGVFNEIQSASAELDGLVQKNLNDISSLKKSSREMSNVAKVYSNFSAAVGEDIHMIKFFDKGDLKDITLSINSPNYFFGTLVFGFGAVLFITGGITACFIPPLGIVLAGFGVVFMGIGVFITILASKSGASDALENLKKCRDNLNLTIDALNQYSQQINGILGEQQNWFSKMNDIANELDAKKANQRSGDELIDVFKIALGNYQQGTDARNRLYNAMTQIDNSGKLVMKSDLDLLKDKAEKVIKIVYSETGGASSFDEEEVEDSKHRNTEIVKSLEVRFLIEALTYDIWDVEAVGKRINELTEGMNPKDLDALIIRIVFLRASNPDQVLTLLKKDKDLIDKVKAQMQEQGLIQKAA